MMRGVKNRWWTALLSLGLGASCAAVRPEAIRLDPEDPTVRAIVEESRTAEDFERRLEEFLGVQLTEVKRSNEEIVATAVAPIREAAESALNAAVKAAPRALSGEWIAGLTAVIGAGIGTLIGRLTRKRKGGEL